MKRFLFLTTILLLLSVNFLFAQSEIRDREPRDAEKTEKKRESTHQPIGPCGNPTTTKDRDEDKSRKENDNSNKSQRRKKDE